MHVLYRPIGVNTTDVVQFRFTYSTLATHSDNYVQNEWKAVKSSGDEK